MMVGPIRTAIRNQLERHADVVKKSTVRKGLDLGLRRYSREDLEAARVAGQRVRAFEKVQKAVKNRVALLEGSASLPVQI
jgi:hypothetical protein